MKKVLPALAAALLAGIGVSPAAQAAVKTIDFGVTSMNTSTLSYTGGSTLDKSADFNFDDTVLTVGSVGLDDNGSGLAVGDLITLSPTDIAYGSMMGNNLNLKIMNGPIMKTWSDSLGTFEEALTTVDSINRGTPNAITVLLSGMVTGPGFVNTPISFLFTANQQGGSNGAITATFTEFARTSPIPESSTWVMMGLGFIGLGYAAVRRSSKDRSALAL